jgi:hypothetical protein
MGGVEAASVFDVSVCVPGQSMGTRNTNSCLSENSSPSGRGWGRER